MLSKYNHKLLADFINKSLKEKKVVEKVAKDVVSSLIETSLRGVDSHGIRLLPHYLKAIDSGRINIDPNFIFNKTSEGTGKLDADHTFGHASGALAMNYALDMASENGISCVSVFNSTHFGAASYFSLIAARKNMVGISFTHADSLLLSHSSNRSFFGTNPICVTFPVMDEEPFCLDMATSLVSWNKILECRSSKKEIPKGWGVDKDGLDTTNPNEVRSLIPAGSYKGFGLSMVIEILCSFLGGMPYGHDITKMYSDPIDSKRNLAHFFMAIDISKFQPLDDFRLRMKNLMHLVRNEPRADYSTPVLCPGDPEKATFEERSKSGIPLDSETEKAFKKIANNLKFVLESI